MMFNRELVVFIKEMRGLLRDKKTVIVGIIIPIFLFPLIFTLINLNIKGNLEIIKKEIKLAVRDRDHALSRFLITRKKYNLVESVNLKEAVLNREAFIALVVPEDYGIRLQRQEPAELKIITDNTSQLSLAAGEELKTTLEAYGRALAEKRGRSIANPLKVTELFLRDKARGSGMMALSLLVPMVILIFAAAAPMAGAADLGAGEKERKTLESLLCTGISRMGLLRGKFFAVSVLGFIGVLAFMTGLFISYRINPEFMEVTPMSFGMEPEALFLIAVYTVMLTMIFGAIELSISIYSRSSREAQTYFLPVLIISMAAGYSTFMVDVKYFSSFYNHIPLVNISITIKKLVLGIYDIKNMAMSFGWSLIYIVLSFFLSGFLFNREEVILRS